MLVVHHVNSDKMLAEAFRVLKPKGKLALSEFGRPEFMNMFEVTSILNKHGVFSKKELIKNIYNKI